MTHIGILNVNKPPNWSSRDVVNRVERLIRPAKAGHAGTLDPLATGVLVICVGQATRLIQYVQRQPKCYHATFLLGQHSETDDIEGPLIPLAQAPQPTRAMIDAALPHFLGDILQRPPAHSAIKIAGRRAYELARRGKPVNLPPRTVSVYRLEVRRLEYPELELDITCGSGTYVRSIGRDLAESLGTAAVMCALERTAIGTFRVNDALAGEDVSLATLGQHLQPAITAVGALPRIEVTQADLVEIRHGRPIVRAENAPSAPSGAEWAGLDSTGQLVAILHEKTPGRLWPACNFG